MVWKLKRSLYGLNQAGRLWSSLLLEHLIAWGFIPTTTDPRVLMNKCGQEVIIILIVVDDMEFATLPVYAGRI